MKKQRERNRARRTAQTPSERQTTTQQKSTTATETPEVRETRLKNFVPSIAKAQETDKAGDHPTVFNSIYC